MGDLDTNSVHLVRRESGADPTDYFALVPRQHAEAYFDRSFPTDEEIEKREKLKKKKT